MEITPGPVLQTILTPDDIKRLPKSRLAQLCNELRSFIIDTVSVYGGHFSGNLGVVELTVALHYVFDTPKDQIVWDVGHQAYAHKILTGRRNDFHTIRHAGGLSGFPKRAESNYDSFGTGHSSTSISAALGMALADKYQQKNNQHIAIIGDGAMTGGEAFEALNHAGVSATNLLIILNDNSISIDPNVGAFQQYLKKLARQGTAKQDSIKADGVSTTQRNHTQSHPSLRQETNFFEQLNISYFGPDDGHDVLALVKRLEQLKTLSGPKLLHIKTIKGKGFARAEEDQTRWHAPGLFDKITGEIHKKQEQEPQPLKYQDVFGKTILELARANEKIMAVTPAMPSGSSLKFMMDAMPHRAFDVDICEQHAVTLCAGMATRGMRPFCAIYSTFLQRAYDQLIHDVALQNLPVVFCVDRAGLVGEDGPTHHGVFDIASLRPIPNLIISSPMNEPELRNLMYTAQLKEMNNPFVIRYPRGKGITVDWETPFERIPVGKGRKLKEGEKVAVLSFGPIGNTVAAAIEEHELQAAHYDLRFVKPLDEDLLHEVMNAFESIITVEDGVKKGGMGSAIGEFMLEHGYKNGLTVLGVPDEFIEHGSVNELHGEINLSAEHIAKIISQKFKH